MQGLNFLEPGEMHRTAAETVQIIKHQIYLACGGVACRVSELQTETGVKDRTAQCWIDRALERSSILMRERTNDSVTQDPRLKGKLRPEERKRIKEAIQTEISAEVYRWVIQQPTERYGKLLEDSREYPPPDFFDLSNILSGAALRNELRPGDHYNILFGFPGAFTPNQSFDDTCPSLRLHRIRPTPGFVNRPAPYNPPGCR